jgi:hypothetical protein
MMRCDGWLELMWRGATEHSIVSRCSSQRLCWVGVHCHTRWRADSFWGNLKNSLFSPALVCKILSARSFPQFVSVHVIWVWSLPCSVVGAVRCPQLWCLCLGPIQLCSALFSSKWDIGCVVLLQFVRLICNLALVVKHILSPIRSHNTTQCTYYVHKQNRTYIVQKTTIDML